jgi:hypothetical protein
MTQPAPIPNDWLARQDPAKVAASLAKLRAARERNDRRTADYFRGLGETDEHFALWLALCDAACARMVGVGIFDIADWTWADAYGDGMSPREATGEALADDTYAEIFGD